MKKTHLAVMILALGLTGCTVSIRRERHVTTYNAKIKSVEVNEKDCTLELSHYALGGGKVTDLKIEECKSLKPGDHVMIQELTINGRHSASVWK